MRAILLLGGLGTRLRPLTDNRPKQMLPVVDRPMIEWVIAALERHGVDDVVLSLGYRPDAFEVAYPEGRCGAVRLHYAVESEPLDTAGAIRFAAEDARIAGRFLVFNGDVLSDLDIGALVAFHDRSGAEGTISLHRVEDPSRFGVVPTDAEGRVTAFVEKPAPGEAPTDLVNAGAYVLEPSVLERIPLARRVSIERETFPAMAAEGTLFARDDLGVYWVDTGTPQQYLQAQLDIIDGVRGPAPPPIAPTATIAPDATVLHSVVMDGATVGPGAHVVDAALLPGSRVEAGAHVEGSIVGFGAVVGPKAKVTDGSVVADGATVET